MDFRRAVKCSNCGGEANVSIASDLELKEVVIAGKCRCGATLQMTYNIVSNAPPPSPPLSPEPPSHDPINIDESLFGGGDIPSDTLRDLMEE
jgi:hypothetical protein